jgi:hypothetical protein
MVFDNKNVVKLVGSSELLKREKREIFYINEKSFIVYVFFLCTL